MPTRLTLLLLSVLLIAHASAADGPRLEDVRYPYPPQIFRFQSQQQELEMAYMDVPAKGADRRGTVVLFHGKNFSGAYWRETAAALSERGFRVLIPDQIGFGKSSKPEHYQFSFHQLAANTHALLEKVKAGRVHLVGHSMGGMVATRYALMFPADVVTLTLANPIGLEDWKAKGVPYQSLDAALAEQFTLTTDKLRAYERKHYYGGDWRPDYDEWVELIGHFLRSPDYPRMAWNQALTSDMLYTQPVVYEFPQLKMPVLLIIGQRDRTAPGADRAPANIRDSLGNYPELGRAASRAIPQAKLVELDGLGHLPHIEDFPRFIAPLHDFLSAHSAAN
ncbi:MAG TPA: alpha/beta hydrolase [Opitutus sp.]|nr:alpha/beta hydrolase [Opitutus sp.]